MTTHRSALFLGGLALVAAALAGCEDAGAPAPMTTAESRAAETLDEDLAREGYRVETTEDGSKRFRNPLGLLPQATPLGDVRQPSAANVDVPAAEAGTGGAGEPAAGAGAPARQVTLSDLPDAVRATAEALAGKAPATQAVAFDFALEKAETPGAAGGPPMPEPAAGRVQMLLPDRMRIDGTGAANGTEMEMTVVMNQGVLWMEARDPNTDLVQTVVKFDMNALGGAMSGPSPMEEFAPMPEHILTAHAQQYTFTDVRDDTVGGTPCKVFEGTAKGQGAEAAKVLIWIGTEDGLMRKRQTQDAAGTPIETVTLSNIDTNPSIATAVFDYSPPADVEVMDMGEMMKAMIQGMGEAMEGADDEATMTDELSEPPADE